MVTALCVLAAAVVIAQVVSRTLRVSDEERESMAALGWRRRDLAVERAIEGGIAAIAAAPIAGLVVYALTSMFPLGVLRSIEPDPVPHVDWLVTVAGIVGARWRSWWGRPPSSGCAAHAPRGPAASPAR